MRVSLDPLLIATRAAPDAVLLRAYLRAEAAPANPACEVIRANLTAGWRVYQSLFQATLTHRDTPCCPA
jgi:hypothetical protein